jgi:hypothetical protein
MNDGGDMDTSDAVKGIAWWNRLTEKNRYYWMVVAGSAVPADAWRAYVRAITPIAKSYE